MMHFRRPAKPVSFDTDVKIVRARDAIRGIIERRERPQREDFDAERRRWSVHKPAFAEAQHDKCGFCEANPLITGFGDVEHYRPKAEVRDLPVDRTKLGVSVPHRATPDGRTRGVLVSDYGYWWLAFTWENWLFACTKCNQTYKGNLWPVLESPRGTHLEHCEQHETPLLLNPFDGPDPVKHLAYSPDGLIAERDESLWGRATIDTCGLDRFELTQERRKIARKVFSKLEALEMTPTVVDRERILAEIEALGGDSEPHAGMVRSIVEVHLEGDWRDLFIVDAGLE